MVKQIKCANCFKKFGLFQKKILIHKGFLGDVYICSDNCKLQLLEKANKEFEDMVNRVKKEGREYVCLSCEYRWVSRKDFGNPAICPKCKNDGILRYATTQEWENNFRKSKEIHINHY